MTQTTTPNTTHAWTACSSAWTPRWVATANCCKQQAAPTSRHRGSGFASSLASPPARGLARAERSPRSLGVCDNHFVCSTRRAVYFLEPMLIEPGPGISPGRRDHLALDEPKAKADLAHLNPGSGCRSGGAVDTLFGAHPQASRTAFRYSLPPCRGLHQWPGEAGSTVSAGWGTGLLQAAGFESFLAHPYHHAHRLFADS